MIFYETFYSVFPKQSYALPFTVLIIVGSNLIDMQNSAEADVTVIIVWENVKCWLPSPLPFISYKTNFLVYYTNF